MRTWQGWLSGLAVLLVTVGLLWQRWVAPVMPPTPVPPPQAPTHLLITALFYATGPGGAADQFLRLTNPTPTDIDMTGWSFTSAGSRLTLGSGAVVHAGQTVELARNPASFLREMGWEPTWIMGVGLTQGALEIPPLGGQVTLWDSLGGLVDSVCYGQTLCGAGWNSGPASVPTGSILARSYVEAQGWQTPTFAADTDTAVDWWQGTDWLPHRFWRPGQTFMPEAPLAGAQIIAFTSPQSSEPVLASAIDSARQTLDISAYLFDDSVIARHVAQAAARGVRVRLLLEGAPPEGMLDTQRFWVARLVQAGVQVHFLHNLAENRGRYSLQHATYLILDGSSVLLGSSQGIRAPETGSDQGWWLGVTSLDLARYFSSAFELDFRTLLDTLGFDPGLPGSNVGPPPGTYTPVNPPNGAAGSGSPVTQPGPLSVTPVLGPDHSLWRAGGILGLLDTAQSSIDAAEGAVPDQWGPAGALPGATPNLFLQALVQAARRGVHVRLLLDTAALPWPSNQPTVDRLQTLAAAEHLPLEARLAPARGGGSPHNRGAIVDGRRVLVSGMDWSQVAATGNREAGLLVDSPQIASYFSRDFAGDWGP